LRVQRPFYPESREVCHVYLLHPPGGLVSGDELQIDIAVGRDAWALLTTPGAGKVYGSDGQGVRQQQALRIARGGTLEWLPQEMILFDGARADLGTRVELEGDARFLGAKKTSCCCSPPACWRNGARPRPEAQLSGAVAYAPGISCRHAGGRATAAQAWRS
jgi:hypothetical protein